MELKVGDVLEGKVTGVTKFGAFVDIGENKTGMVHISEVARSFVNDIAEHLKLGDTVKVKVMTIGDDGKVSLSIKRAMEPPPRNAPRTPAAQPGRPDAFQWNADTPDKSDASFEDMMNKFKQTSEDKFSTLKRKNVDMRRGAKRGAPK